MVRRHNYRGEKFIKTTIKLLAREEAMMRQRSRAQWLSEGDRNTAFHARCKEMTRQNRIDFLRKEDGTICRTQKDIEKVAIDFYIKLFTAQEEINTDEVIRYVPSKVTYEMNQILCKPYNP